MFGRKANREIPPGDYAHDASVIAHLGKIYLPAGTIVASSIEAVYLVTDLIQNEGTSDELVAIGQYGALGTASYFVFNALQHHFERRADEIRSSSVTE